MASWDDFESLEDESEEEQENMVLMARIEEFDNKTQS